MAKNLWMSKYVCKHVKATLCGRFFTHQEHEYNRDDGDGDDTVCLLVCFLCV